MICHGFKGGIGTSSASSRERWRVVGVLVQANHGDGSASA
jgi:L-aminopeptidase/D-esterase-like protein